MMSNDGEPDGFRGLEEPDEACEDLDVLTPETIGPIDDEHRRFRRRLAAGIVCLWAAAFPVGAITGSMETAHWWAEVTGPLAGYVIRWAMRG